MFWQHSSSIVLVCAWRTNVSGVQTGVFVIVAKVIPKVSGVAAWAAVVNVINGWHFMFSLRLCAYPVCASCKLVVQQSALAISLGEKIQLLLAVWFSHRNNVSWSVI